MATLSTGLCATLAREFLTASAQRSEVTQPPSARTLPEGGEFDLNLAYSVEAEIARQRAAGGVRAVGRKVGYANKAMWRALKLETLLWARMYDDTVHCAADGMAELPAARFRSPRIEPEIVFKLKSPGALATLPNVDALGAALGDVAGTGVVEAAAGALAQVESIALGFEIIDCPFPEWKFQPADFVAAGGLHAALVVGAPRAVEAADIPLLAAELAAFKIRLLRQDAVIEEGAGRNCLRSPALCLAELAEASRRRGDGLQPGEWISSGTLTTAPAVSRGELWRAELEGLTLPPLGLRFT